MRGSRIVVAILLSGSLAGCVESGEVVPAATSAPSPQVPSLLQPLNLTLNQNDSANMTREDWFYIETSATAEGGATGYSWTLPVGALVPRRSFSQWSVIVAEIAPVYDEESPPLEWALFVFRQGDGGLQPLVQVLAAPFKSTRYTAILPTHSEGSATVDPFVLHLATVYSNGPATVSEGAELFLVLAAKAPAPAPFGLAIRLMDHDPGFDEPAASDWRQFVEKRDGDPFVLAALGSGKGLHVALYQEITGLAIIGTMLRAGSVDILEGLPTAARPMSATRDTVFSTKTAYARGWGAASALFLGDHAIGTWEATGALHGQKLDARSIVVQDGVVPLASFLLIGLPAYTLVGDGEGDASTRFHLKLGHIGDFYALQFSQYGVGAPLRQLVGKDSMDMAYAFTGLVGNVPPIQTTMVKDNVVRLHGDGSTEVWLGAAPTIKAQSP